MEVEMKTQAPAPAEQTQPASNGEEATSCAVRSGKTNYRPWLIGASGLGIALVLYGGWDWLAATGTAAVLIGLAPCLVMCALGLCAARAGKSKPESTLADIRKTYETQSGEPSSRG
jgi:hypothetical protein